LGALLGQKGDISYGQSKWLAGLLEGIHYIINRRMQG